MLIDHLASQAINRKVKPVTLFAFDYEWLRKVRRSPRIPSCLGDQVNQESPRPRLGDFGECPGNVSLVSSLAVKGGLMMTLLRRVRSARLSAA